MFKKSVEPFDPLGPRIGGLKPQRHAVIGEREFCGLQPGRAVEIAERIDSHRVERPKRTRCMRACPCLLREEMRKPEHHAETQVLGYAERWRALLHEFLHLADLSGEPVGSEQPVHDIAMEGIDCMRAHYQLSRSRSR